MSVVTSADTASIIDAEDAVIWINQDTKEVRVLGTGRFPPNRNNWCDLIGAAYSQWQEATQAQRMGLMLETALDLVMQGFTLKTILVAFAEVREFRALGSKSYPMCRALTSALLGRCLEPNTMSFEELLKAYSPKEESHV